MPKILTPAALQAFMDRHDLDYGDMSLILGYSAYHDKISNRTVWNMLKGQWKGDWEKVNKMIDLWLYENNLK